MKQATSKAPLRLLIAVLLPLATLLVTVGCFAPELDEVRIQADLAKLSAEYRAEDIKSEWDYAFLLNGISNHTLRFLYDHQSTELTIPFREKLEITTQGLLQFTEPSVFQSQAPTLSDELMSQLNAELFNIKSETKPWMYELTDRNIRTPHMCKDQCGCIADRLVKVIQEDDSAWALSALLQTGVGIRLKDRPHIYWAYHRVLFVFQADQMGVIDYLIFKDLKPHSYSEWHSQFIPQGTFSLKLGSYE